MTNEEKAREIGEFFETTYLAALEMAEWKDQQFTSMLSEIFDYFDNVVGLYDGGIDHSDVDKPEFIKHFSNRISNTK